MKIGPVAAVALALLAASPGVAQEAKGTDGILAQMPQKLGGAPVLKLPDGILMYFLKGPSGEPVVVGVTVVERDGTSPPVELRSSVRNSMSQRSRIRQIVREGTFTTPKWPGAATFFGEYVTGEFPKQNWTAIAGRDAITVIITYDKKKDARWAEALVADKIFGGAVISAEKPVE